MIKQRMLEQRIRDLERAKQMREWIIMATLRHWVVRIYEIFDHERFLIAHRMRMFPVFLRIRTKMRKRIFAYGKPYEVRERKYVRDSISTMFGNTLRGTIRERAKMQILGYCNMHYEKAFMVAKFQKYLETVILIQRMVRLRYIIKQHNKTLFDKKSQDIVKAAAGLRTLIVCIFKNRIATQQDLIR